VRLQGLGLLKNPVTFLKIEPATFRLVAESVVQQITKNLKGEWRELHNKELHIFVTYEFHYYDDEIKQNRLAELVEQLL
jgi:hypothetical protein